MDERTRRFMQRQARQLRDARAAERGVQAVNDLMRGQPCAVSLKSRCSGSQAATLLWPGDESITVPVPACGVCAAVIEAMLEKPGQRQEAEYRLLEAGYRAVSRLVDSHHLAVRRRDFGSPRPPGHLCQGRHDSKAQA